MSEQWWCEAYGPPPPEADPAAWPRCFVGSSVDPAARCSTRSVCEQTMAVERRRVHARILELAAAGDETCQFLAGEFPTSDRLLGGSGEEPA